MVVLGNFLFVRILDSYSQVVMIIIINDCCCCCDLYHAKKLQMMMMIHSLLTLVCNNL